MCDGEGGGGGEMQTRIGEPRGGSSVSELTLPSSELQLVISPLCMAIV